MKLRFTFLFLAAAASVASIDADETYDHIPTCVDKIPEGANPADYNICREHPLGHDSMPVVSTLRTKTQTPEELAAECGDLGVMEVPEGEDPSHYRKCRDHPLKGQEGSPSTNVGSTPANPLLRARAAALNKRACRFDALEGCWSGYCWSRCDLLSSGKWCWTAIDYGNGEWARCSIDAQCDPDWVTVLRCGGGCTC